VATTTTSAGGTVHLGLVFNNNSSRLLVTTAHLLAHLLEELARLLASHKLELVALAASDGGGVSGRTIEGDKSFRGTRHSVLYYLEEKFLGVERLNALKKL
jgi:hypothetical protein